MHECIITVTDFLGINENCNDTYCLFENSEHVHSFLDYINKQHPNVKFIFEIESDNSLPFLDVSLSSDGSGFSTTLYRKKTFTGLYTEFSSLAPNKYKVNLISILIYIAFHICSTVETCIKEPRFVLGSLNRFLITWLLF